MATTYFRNSYRYVWRGTTSIGQLKKNLDGSKDNLIVFTVPQLICQGCYSPGEWNSVGTDLFEMNTKTTVYRQNVLNGVIQSAKTAVYTFYSGPTSISNAANSVYYASGGIAYLRGIVSKSYGPQSSGHSGFESNYSNRPAIAHSSSTFANKEISFSTTILTADELESGKSYYYTIECVANPDNADGMLSYYEAAHDGSRNWNLAGLISYYDNYKGSFWTTSNTQKCTPSSVIVETSFFCKNLAEPAEGGPFLMKGVKYSCYQLLRKAMLTLDTRIINNDITGLDEAVTDNGTLDVNNIQYPVVIDPVWVARLKNAVVNETILENKNFWEVCIQIGYYLHAIPFFEFADDGTDRLKLSFRQLGGTKLKDDKSGKITIFNSRAVYDYFAAYDSYVTNLFSPQNLTEEWIRPKTSSSDYLICNDTAELHVTKGITEILEFDIYYNGVWKDALNPQANNGDKTVRLSAKLFEESIYQILTSDYTVSPGKADSLYFKMGDNKILGLNYVPPSANNDQPMALKKIVRQLFGVSVSNLKFNDLMFHVKYRTQDSARVTQLRPDLQKFIKNSVNENYPHHEQFFNPQDKIVDSERFGANLYGRLIKCGNAVYQRQEFCVPGDEKESGDLIMIDNYPYYVMSAESEEYKDVTLQKVTYSRDFNQISQIVTIPSEPRFYEVSERSSIRREVRLMDFLLLTTTPSNAKKYPRFLNSASWSDFVKNIIFRENAPTLPNFAYTRFLGDKKRQHTGQYGQVVPLEQLFPSSETEKLADNVVRPKSSSDHVDCIVPLARHPMYNSLVFSWDMLDNFKAGDGVDTSINGTVPNSNEVDGAYYAQQPLRYCDILGRADLFNFMLFNKTDWADGQAQQLPKAPFIPTAAQCQALSPAGNSIALDKDCREELSFNYQLNLLHNPTDSDTEDFIVLPNVWGDKLERLRMAICRSVKSMFDEKLNISGYEVLHDNVQYRLLDNNGSIEIRITAPANFDAAEANSIVLYEQDEFGNRSAYIIKNISKLSNDKKLQSWWLYPAFSDNNTEPAPQVYTVNIASSGAGSVSPFGRQEITAGESLTVTAIPQTEEGFDYFRVTRGNNLVVYTYTSNPLTLEINQDTSITAVFRGSGGSQFTVDISSGAGGTVSPSGQEIVEAGGTITITATPNAGATFRHFKVTRGNNLVVYQYTDNPVMLEINANTTVTAVFTSGGGTIEV